MMRLANPARVIIRFAARTCYDAYVLYDLWLFFMDVESEKE